MKVEKESVSIERSRWNGFADNVLTSGHIFEENEQALRLKFRLFNLFLLFNLVFITLIVVIRWKNNDFGAMWLDFDYAFAVMVIFALARLSKKRIRHLIGIVVFLIYLIVTILFYYELNPLSGISWYVLFLMVTAVFLGHFAALISYAISAITVVIMAVVVHNFSLMTVLFGMLPYTASLLFAYFFINENTLMFRAIELQKHRYFQLAKTDALTGIANREHFQDLLREALVHLSSEGERAQRLAVLFIDLDRFKQTNDTHGHSIGDMVLSVTAQRIRDSVRYVDTLARYGGDEFTVILRNCGDLEHLRNTVERILAATEQPIEINGLQIEQNISLGIAIAPEDGMKVEHLLERADAAMYHAKDRPGSAYAFYRRTFTESHSDQLIDSLQPLRT